MPKTILPPFEVSVQSGEKAVREALQKLLEALRPLELDTEEVGTVELVVAEVLNNIVEHAYPDAAPGGPIEIRCVHKPDGLHVRIRDRGESMPDGQAPLGVQANISVDLDDLPEGGFGWFLIRDLAKDVSYARSRKENQLDMRLAVAVRRSALS